MILTLVKLVGGGKSAIALVLLASVTVWGLFGHWQATTTKARLQVALATITAVEQAGRLRHDHLVRSSQRVEARAKQLEVTVKVWERRVKDAKSLRDVRDSVADGMRTLLPYSGTSGNPQPIDCDQAAAGSVSARACAD